ncbi:MAG: hypothetical protein U1C56_00705, partial [Candidatus Curtissbacteria bacterium]|nr:hypothetical protein [Candidatus Curtissbacteria bacterium]
VEAGEGRKLDVILKNAAEVAHDVAQKTRERFAFIGSIGMYALLNEMREENPQVGDLLLLEQRIAGGKNDFDVCVTQGKKQAVMQEFGWNENQQKDNRGHIDSGKQMVDLMERQEKPEFPWQVAKLEGENVYVQNPEEMVFEKTKALVDPGLDDEGNPRTREIKWGVDIKILKTYLMIKKGISPEELDVYLAGKWKTYAEAERYGSIMQLSEQYGASDTVQGLLKPVLEKTLGKPVEDVSAGLISYAGNGSEATVDALLAVTGKASFVEAMKIYVDHKMGELTTYEEIQANANSQYSELLRPKIETPTQN